MGIRKFTRHRGWSRLFKVFIGLWYGVYILLIGTVFVLNEWQWKVEDDFYLIAVIWALIPWILLLLTRLLRYVIEGFATEESP